MRPIRLAVIGAGHLGRIHARLAKTVPGIELVGVADPLEANRTAAAAEYGVPAFADHRELLGRIDAAVIATPTRFHHAVGMDLLGARRAPAVEKPLAATLAEADDLVRSRPPQRRRAASRTRRTIQSGAGRRCCRTCGTPATSRPRG